MRTERPTSPGKVLPDPPPPPPAEIAGLRPLAPAVIARASPDGPPCLLDPTTPGGPLLAASPDLTIADLAGQLTRLDPAAATLAELRRGTTFGGTGLIITIDNGFEPERIASGTRVIADLRIMRARAGFSSNHHRWECRGT